jgi:hypothetical protein
LILGKQVSLRRAMPVAGVIVIQVASTVEGIALCHSKPRVRRAAAALTVLKTRCATQVEDPNIIYRVEASGHALTAPTERGSSTWYRTSEKGR